MHKQETITWLELILIMAVIIATALFLVYLFTGYTPMDIPSILLHGNIFEKLKGDVSRLKVDVPSESKAIIGLSLFSARAFTKSLFS